MVSMKKWPVFQLRGLRLALLATGLSAMLFAIEPTREFFMESVIERQYTDLQAYQRISRLVSSQKKMKPKDMQYTLAVLQGIENRNPSFLLMDDARLVEARIYRKQGNSQKSREILDRLLASGKDPLCRIDASMEIAAILESKNQPARAIAIVEDTRRGQTDYRKGEVNFLLSRLYYQMGKKEQSARSLLEADFQEKEEIAYFKKVIAAEWEHFSTPEKMSLVRKMGRKGMAEDVARFSARLVNEGKLEAVLVEKMSLEVLYQTGKHFEIFLSALKQQPSYASIADEMRELYTLSHHEIHSSSAAVRGSYCQKKLKKMCRKAKYKPDTAVELYLSYLDGQIEPEYARKNLEIVIRNLLAFKRYDTITNMVGKTTSQLSLSVGSLGESVAFWDGFARMRLGDTSGAIASLEEAIIRVPDGYFSVQAREMIESLNTASGVRAEDYQRSLQKKFQTARGYEARLRAGRLLFAFQKGAAKERTRAQVAEMLRKFENGGFFDYDQRVLSELKNRDAYTKFVVHTRFGLLSRARAILTAANITDTDVQNILILREVVKNRDFRAASPLYLSLASSAFVQENFPFFSKELQMLLYPTPYDSEIQTAVSRISESQLDRSLVYAVIRGESMYISSARSRVGARGLMQIMPSTAKLISKKVVGNTSVNLFDPLVNIQLGTYYLNDGIVQHGLLPAVASYNGGIRIVEKMRRTFRPETDVEWMELIPYVETREYVRKIVCFYSRYKNLYDEPRDEARNFWSDNGWKASNPGS